MSMEQTVKPNSGFKERFKSILLNDNVAFIPTLLVSCFLLMVLYLMHVQGYSSQPALKDTKPIESSISQGVSDLNVLEPKMNRPNVPAVKIASAIAAPSNGVANIDYIKTLKHSCEVLIKAKGIIQFEPRTNYLNNSSQQNLEALVPCFKEHKVHVSGHTDSIGTVERKLEVSQMRAMAVQEFLVARGVPATYITAVGMSDSLPIADNNTAEGRSKNRRIEFKIESLAQPIQ
jgi:outer membrane protein OmpA-like peptidoglycan-associated protein